MRPIQVVFSGDRCSCGALLENSERRCHKCRNRARWLRRKDGRHHTAARPYSDAEVPSLRRR
jgi:hypothetical protein